MIEALIKAGGAELAAHSLRVAARVALAGGSADAVLAALLHDAVEDGAATLTEIEHEHGAEVARIVEIVTRRAGEVYRAYIERVAHSGCESARLIKLADLFDHVAPERIGVLSASMVKRYAMALDALGAWPVAR